MAKRISAWDKDIQPIIVMVHNMADVQDIENEIRDLVECAYREGREEGAASERRYPHKEDMGR